MKSKDVQPFIRSTTKGVIYKLSYITGQSVKQICNDLSLYTLSNKKELIEELSPYVKWDIKIENNLYPAKRKPIKDYPLSDNLERVTVKIDLNAYEFANGLAYSLSWSVAKVIAYCIERSMNDFAFVNKYLMEQIEASMGESQMVKINKIIMDVNTELEENHSVAALLFGIVDELKAAEQNFNETYETLYQFAEKW